MAQPDQDKKKAGRLAFIDWTRGLAAVVMLQGHTFNSFTKTELRPQAPYMLSQFAGGLPPAIFLFLTGITFAFLMDTQDRKGASRRSRLLAALKRSRYLFVIAFLFRLQMFLTGYPTSPASEIWKVDILNCMGFAMLVFVPAALLTTIDRVRWSILAGGAIACLAPVTSTLNSPRIPSLVRAYLLPDYNQFGFFPWAAFLAFGLATGSVLRLVRPEDMQRALLWMFAVGATAAAAAHYLSNLPYSVYSNSEYWLNSPALIFVKSGLVLCLLGLAFLWTNLASADRWSLFRQLGTTSLIVYWVHIELVYGRWFGIWKEALTPAGVLLYTIVLIAFMTCLSIMQTRYKDRFSRLSFFSAHRGRALAPRPAPSGD